jgi:hypothetical protein
MQRQAPEESCHSGCIPSTRCKAEPACLTRAHKEGLLLSHGRLGHQASDACSGRPANGDRDAPAGESGRLGIPRLIQNLLWSRHASSRAISRPGPGHTTAAVQPRLGRKAGPGSGPGPASTKQHLVSQPVRVARFEQHTTRPHGADPEQPHLDRERSEAASAPFARAQLRLSSRLGKVAGEVPQGCTAPPLPGRRRQQGDPERRGDRHHRAPAARPTARPRPVHGPAVRRSPAWTPSPA